MKKTVGWCLVTGGLCLMAGGMAWAGLDNPHATKKMIAIGWDISPRVAEDLIRHQDEIAAMGFDGVGLSAACPELDKNGKPRTWGSAVYGKYGVGDPEKFFAIAEPLRKLNAGPLKHNFVSFTLFFAKRNRWEDDEFWKFSCEKAAAFARLAKLGGCRGESKKNSLKADDTLDSRFEQQKQEFYSYSGLSVI